VAVTPLYDENGVATRLIGIVHDVTEHKAAEAAINEANARKSDFIAALSHELRNPLAAISASLAVVDLAAGSADGMRAREIVGRQVTHMARLVDDLLDITRITRGRIELDRASVELGALLRRTVDDHRAAFEARGVACEVDGPDTELWLDADATRLVQVLGNIFGNAIKFTPTGGRVTVSATRENELAVVRVRDNGIGIDPETLDLLFQPFTQARPPLDHGAPGLGLGLAIVKVIVELHGGTVAVASEGANRGTEITVRIPLACAAASSEVAPVSDSVPSRRVLIIEDNADASEALRLLLQLRGHEVRACADGPAGVAIARSFSPQVVICDLGLPGMSGYEIARLLRVEGGRPPVLVAVSGYALPRDRERSAAAGFAHHLPKPIAVAELERLIAGAV
jgi:two-component system CheB/CheR fusion protein